MRRAPASIGLAAVLLAWSTQAASAAPTQSVVEGEVLRLVSVQDAQAMATMRPGEPVSWDVGVSSSEPDGTIDVALGVDDATTGAYRAAVHVCAEPWSDAGCPPGGLVLHDGPLVAGETVALAQQHAAAEAWYRVEVTLLESRGGASADLRLTADGFGEVLSGGGEAGEPAPQPPGAALGLPPTGGRIAWYGLLALVAIGTGALVARVPARTREGRRCT